MEMEQLDDRSVLAAARAAIVAERRAGCRLLEAAAAWADLHPSESILTPAQRLQEYGEKAVLFGGEGTQDVAETAAAALGAEIGMNPERARNLMADALDARDRMPEVWQLVDRGQVWRQTVHRVASKTRHLTKQQVADISRHVASSLSRLTPGQRLDNLVDAEIMRVDRERLEQAAVEAIHDRYVCKGRPDPEGMTDLFIHTTVADAEASMAAINELAAILRARQDQLPPGVPVRGARTTDGGPSGRDGTECMGEWRAVAAQLLQTNPGLAFRIQLEAKQPDLFDELQDDHRLAALIKHLDLSRLQPATTLHVHISETALDRPSGPADPQAAVGRVEGIGPMFLEVVQRWLGEACTVRLQPVINTGDIPPVDRYEFPPAMREAMLSQSPASRFPWSNSLSRRNDLDHTVPYLPPARGGPPGQTGMHNGGPLTRREHRYKTFGQIAVRQPQPDTHLWKTEYGRVLVVNPSGTFDLGAGEFARAVWIAGDCLDDQHSVVEHLVRERLALSA